jgi:galactokinase/galacturonokinase
MKPYKIAIFFSGLERSLANSEYNLRQDECKAAAYALMGFAGMSYGTFSESRLRNVPVEVYREYGDMLPDRWRKRELNCGERVTWMAMDSLYLKAAGLQ